MINVVHDISAHTDTLPAYLQPFGKSDVYYGTLEYREKDDMWLIKAQPMVMQLVKRLFPASEYSPGIAKFKPNKRITGDLNWLMMRYPLKILHPEKWNQEYEKSVNHVLHTKEMIVQPKKEVPKLLFKGILREYQKEALAWMLHFKRTLLADDTGLGKTVSFIALMASVNIFPVLIVCPKHLMAQWREMICEFMEIPVPIGGNMELFPSPEQFIHEIKGTKPYPLPNASIYITHYELLGYWKDILPVMNFTVVGYDEIHRLRHSKTNKYSAASLISDSAEYVIGMSGTPIYNYGNEMWNIMNIIEHHCLGDWESFSREWCVGYGEKIVAKPELLGEYLRSEGLLLRRTKDLEEIKKEIPPKYRAVYPVDMEENIFRKLMKTAIRQAKEYDNIKEWNKKGLVKTQIIEDTRLATGVAKAPYVALFVRSLLENGERVILFGFHHDVYGIWEEELKDFQPAIIHGKSKNREGERKRFLNEETNLLILSIRAAEGLNLQGSCRCVVFGELDWSPAVHKQAEDRVHRLGQSEQVMVYYLVAAGGSDEDMQETLGLKTSQFIGLMGDKIETEEDKAFSQSVANKHMNSLIERLKKMT